MSVGRMTVQAGAGVILPADIAALHPRVGDHDAARSIFSITLSCPSIVAKIGEGPRFHDFMNQIKQEFCSARWLIDDATRDHPAHFSDNDVLLYNTLDYLSYGLQTEQLKLGF